MSPNVRKWFELPRLIHTYKRKMPLVLVNGLAEQSESWFANRAHLSRHFDLKVPEILVYDGELLQQRIASGAEVTVQYLMERLARFLDEYVDRPPYHLVGSSLGCQVVLTYATSHAAKVSKLVLVCPSGLHGNESLPVLEGVRRGDYETLVSSVFYRNHFATEELVRAFERKFQQRQWKKGVLRTVRGTLGHSVAELLPLVPHATLLIWGANDRILSDVAGSVRAAEQIRRARQVVIPKCGHAPQIEKARLVNHLISRFLRDKLRVIPPDLDPYRFLNQQAESPKPRGGFLVAAPRAPLGR